MNGSSSDVGAVGYTLGGGLPVVGRTYGFAADHVRSLELVTADSALRQVDQVQEPDLFWALRGGQGNFGVVTGMVVDLVPLTRLYDGAVYYPGEHAAGLLRAFRDWTAGLPERSSASVALLRLPPLPVVPEPLRGRFTVAVRFTHIGDHAEGERLLAPMRAVAPAILDTVQDMPYAAIDFVHADPVDPIPFREHGMSLRALTAEATDALLAAAGPSVESPFLMLELRLLGGALARPPELPNAVSGRDGAFSLLAVGLLRRLCLLKDEVDPQNLFRFGHALRRSALPPEPALV